MAGIAKVTIEKKNGALGSANILSPDGEAMLVIAVSGSPHPVSGYVYPVEGTFIVLTSYQQYFDVYGEENAEGLYKVNLHVKDFFSAGGKKLHLFFTLPAGAMFLLDPINFVYPKIKQYLVSQNGSIELLGFVTTPSSVQTNANGVDTNLSAIVGLAQNLATSEFLDGRPIHILLEARKGDLKSSTLLNMRALNAPNVSIVAWQAAETQKYRSTTLSIPVTYTGNWNYGLGVQMGYTLGALAAVPVQRNIGRVRNGAIAYKTGITLPDGLATSVDTLSKDEKDSIADKGYIFAIRHPQVQGYFISDDPSCTLVTDDFAWINRIRTINKAARLARMTFTDRLLDEVYTDPATGKLSTITIKSFEAEMDEALKAMVAAGECTAASVFIDPDQDVLTTGEIKVEVRVIPVGIARYIKVTVGFAKIL